MRKNNTDAERTALAWYTKQAELLCSAGWLSNCVYGLLYCQTVLLGRFGGLNWCLAFFVALFVWLGLVLSVILSGNCLSVFCVLCFRYFIWRLWPLCWVNTAITFSLLLLLKLLSLLFIIFCHCHHHYHPHRYHYDHHILYCSLIFISYFFPFAFDFRERNWECMQETIHLIMLFFPKKGM